MKRGTIFVSILLLAIVIPFASSFLWFGNDDVKESPVDATVTVGNAAPVVTITSLTPNPLPLNAAPSPGTPVNIIFEADDSNGIGTLDDSSVAILFDFNSGTEQRTGGIGDCTISDLANIRTYDCTINMQYFDAAGTWDVTVDVSDDAGTPLTGQDTGILDVELLKDITLAPLTINFGGVSSGATDITAALPTTITNNGNHVVDGLTTFFTIESSPLVGETDPAYSIPATNFRSAGSSEGNVCGAGTPLDGTPTQTQILSAILAKGSSGNTEDISHCLTIVPVLIDQVYSASTGGGQSWEIRI